MFPSKAGIWRQAKSCGFATITLIVPIAFPTLASAQSSGTSNALTAIQSLLNGQPAAAQQLLQNVQSGSGSPTNPQVAITPSATAQTTTIAPAGTAAPSTPAPSALPQSRLEKIMSDRAGVPLSLFGYDRVGSGATVSTTVVGAVPDDYILGPGDQLDVSIRGQGQTSEDYRVSVDRDGNVILPGVSPVGATGRAFGDFRQAMQAAVRRTFVGSQAFITLAQLRQINVLVTGFVNTPGMRAMTALSSPLDAILVSGGIEKTGSLRSIVIERAGQRITYDLYGVLTQTGIARRVLLQDGDRIVVGPLGRTAAITGWVRNPGIYELPAHAGEISTRELISLVGGTEVRGLYQLSLRHIGRDGRTVMQTIPQNTGRVGDSDILFVAPASDHVTSQLNYAGGQSLAGRFSTLGHSGKLSSLLKQPGALGDAPYTLFGIISRRDPTTYLRELIAFSPAAIIAGRDDIKLEGDDVVRVLSLDEFRLLEKASQAYQSQALLADQQSHNLALSPASLAQAQSANAVLQTAVSPQNQTPQAAPVAAFDVANVSITSPTPVSGETGVTNFGDMATQLSIDPAVLVSFTVDHEAQIGGAVRKPGSYLVGPSTLTGDLIAAAGGLALNADESGVQITSTAIDRANGKSATLSQALPLRGAEFANYIVKPQDDIHFNAVYSTANAGAVQIDGEVRSPGSYTITHGEHLSEALVKAGGLTDVAYPRGTVFLRKSIASQEAEAYQRVADQLQTQLLVAIGTSPSGSSGNITPDAALGLSSLMAQMRNQPPIGRVSYIADPSMLAANPERDPILEPGDVIFIPQTPSSVTVLGEVGHPGSFALESGHSVSEYIDEAGGYGRYADEDYTIVVYPDGRTRSADSSWIHFESETIPPGSVIFVPKNILPINWLVLSASVGDILKDLAISAASLAVLDKNK